MSDKGDRKCRRTYVDINGHRGRYVHDVRYPTGKVEQVATAHIEKVDWSTMTYRHKPMMPLTEMRATLKWRWDEMFKALRSSMKVVLTRSDQVPGSHVPGTLKRKRTFDVWEIADLVIDEETGEHTFRLVRPYKQTRH